jgi:hypothetical protein
LDVQTQLQVVTISNALAGQRQLILAELELNTLEEEPTNYLGTITMVLSPK